MVRASSLFEKLQDFHVRKGGFPETRRKHQRKFRGQEIAKDCAATVPKVEEPCDEIRVPVQEIAEQCATAAMSKGEDLCDDSLAEALRVSSAEYEAKSKHKWEPSEVAKTLNALEHQGYNIFNPAGDGHCGPNALNFVASASFDAKDARDLVCHHVLRLTNAELSCLSQGLLQTRDAAVKWAQIFCKMSYPGIFVCREFVLFYAHMMAFKTHKAGVIFLCKPESGEDGEFDVHFNSGPYWVNQAIPNCSSGQLNSLAAKHLVLLFTGEHYIGVRPTTVSSVKLSTVSPLEEKRQVVQATKDRRVVMQTSNSVLSPEVPIFAPNITSYASAATRKVDTVGNSRVAYKPTAKPVKSGRDRATQTEAGWSKVEYIGHRNRLHRRRARAAKQKVLSTPEADARKVLEKQKAKEAAELRQEQLDKVEMAAQLVLQEAARKELIIFMEKMFIRHKQERAIRQKRLWDKRWNKYCNCFKSVKRNRAQSKREEEAEEALARAAAARRIKIEKIVNRELARRKAARKIQKAYRRFARRKAARKMKERNVSRELREVFAKYVDLKVIQKLGEWCGEFEVSHLVIAVNLMEWRIRCSFMVPNEELNRCVVNIVLDNGLVRGFGSETYRRKLKRDQRRAALEKQNALKVTVQNPQPDSNEEDDPEREDEQVRSAEDEEQEPARGDVTLSAQIPETEEEVESFQEGSAPVKSARSETRRSTKSGRAHKQRGSKKDESEQDERHDERPRTITRKRARVTSSSSPSDSSESSEDSSVDSEEETSRLRALSKTSKKQQTQRKSKSRSDNMKDRGRGESSFKKLARVLGRGSFATTPIADYKWVELKGVTPHALVQAKKNFIHDLTELCPHFSGRSKSEWVQIFPSFLPEFTRGLVTTFIKQNADITWEEVLLYFLYPNGSKAHTSSLRAATRRFQAPEETTEHYFMDMVKAQNELAAVCPMEKGKKRKHVDKELCSRLKDGLNLYQPNAVERGIVEGLHKWLTRMEEKKVTFSDIQHQINSLKHQHESADKCRQDSKVRSGVGLPSSSAPRFQALHSELREQGNLPEQEQETETSSKLNTKTVTRVFENKRNRKPKKEHVQLEEESEDSEEEEPVLPKRQKRDKGKQVKKQKDNLNKIVVEFQHTQNPPAALRTTTPAVTTAALRTTTPAITPEVGGRRPYAPRDNRCRHCNKTMGDKPNYRDHDCAEKRQNSFYCPGCEGPVPGVTTPGEYFEHLHLCQKYLCNKCQSPQHFNGTCPSVTCNECGVPGHMRILHMIKLKPNSTFAPYLLNSKGPTNKGPTRQVSFSAKSKPKPARFQMVTEENGLYNDSDSDSAKDNLLVRGHGDREDETWNNPDDSPSYSPSAEEEADEGDLEEARVENITHDGDEHYDSSHRYKDIDGDEEDLGLEEYDPNASQHPQMLPWYHSPPCRYLLPSCGTCLACTSRRHACVRKRVMRVRLGYDVVRGIGARPLFVMFYGGFIPLFHLIARDYNDADSVGRFDLHESLRLDWTGPTIHKVIDSLRIAHSLEEKNEFYACSHHAAQHAPVHKELSNPEGINTHDERCEQQRKKRRITFPECKSSNFEWCLQRLPALVVQYFTRIEHDRVKVCSTSTYICLTAEVAARIKLALVWCSAKNIDLCSLMPLNVQRRLEEMDSLDLAHRHLCFACAIFSVERCFQHGSPLQQRFRHVYIIQDQFLPPKNNVEALYLRLNRCLVSGGKVVDMAIKVQRIEDMLQEKVQPDFRKHHLQCMMQGILWDIYETNVLNSVTNFLYGGRLTLRQMSQPTPHLPPFDGDVHERYMFNHLQVQHIALDTLRHSWDHQQLYTRKMVEIYENLKDENVFLTRDRYVPMDLYRQRPQDGMFATLAHNWWHLPDNHSFETQSARFQTYQNKIWSSEMITAFLLHVGLTFSKNVNKLDLTISGLSQRENWNSPLYLHSEAPPEERVHVISTLLGVRQAIVSHLTQEVETRNLHEELADVFQSSREMQRQLREKEERERTLTELSTSNGLVRGTGESKRDFKKRRVDSNADVKAPERPSSSVKSSTKLELLYLPYLDGQGWECTMTLLIRKSCEVTMVVVNGRNQFQLCSKVNSDVKLLVDKLLQRLQMQIDNPGRQEDRDCSKCKLREQCPFFDGDICTMCIFGYEIAVAKAVGSKLILTDVRNKMREFDMKVLQPVVHIKKSDRVSEQHFSKANAYWTVVGENIKAKNYERVAKLTASILNDASFLRNGNPLNDGLVNDTGTTCWAHAICQCLARCLEFTQELQRFQTSNKDLIALRDLMFLLGGGVPPKATRQQIKEKTQACMKHLLRTVLIPNANNRQQDADEGFRNILDLLQVQQVTEAHELFQGVKCIARKCMRCTTVEVREERFVVPYLPLTDKVDTISSIVARNITHKNAKSEGRCETCESRTDWETTESVKRFPKFCIVHLQRAVKHETEGRSGIKNTTKIAEVTNSFTVQCEAGETEFVPLAWIQHLGKTASEGHFITCTKMSITHMAVYNDSRVTLDEIDNLDTSQTAAILFETRMPRGATFQTALSTSEVCDGTRVDKANTGKSEHAATQCSQSSQKPEVLVTKLQKEMRAKEVEAATRRAELVTRIMTRMEPPAVQGEDVRNECQHFSNEKSEPQFLTEPQAPQSELPRTVRVLNWNVRSLRNMLSKTPKAPFEVERFEIVVLTETQTNLGRLAKHAKFKKTFSQFQYAFWNTCLYDKQMGYCGVGVLCKAKPNSVQWGFTTEKAECRTGRVVVLRWANVTLVAVYAPSCLEDSAAEVNDFFKKLQALVCQERVRCFTFIVGDLNIPLTTVDVSLDQPWLKGHTREYVKDQETFNTLLNACELRDSCANLAGTFTWFPENTKKFQRLNVGMRLDYVLVPLAAQIVCCGVLTHLTSSDHRALMVEFNLTAPTGLATDYYQCNVKTVDESEQQEDRSAEMMRHTVEQMYAFESQDFSPQESTLEEFSELNGLAQPAFHHISLHPQPVEKVEEDEQKRIEDEMEIEFVVHSLKAYCRLKELRKLRDELPPPRVKIYLVGIFGVLTVHFGLVDTGATLCLCDAQLARKHIPNFEELLTPLKSFSMYLGDGETTMTVIGKMQITFEMENEEGVRFGVTQWFFITRGLPDCWVLGDALFKDQRQHKADISQYHRQLMIKGHVVPYVAMLPHFHLYLNERETLPAGAKVKCFLSNSAQKKFKGRGTVCDRVDVAGVHLFPQEIFVYESGGIWAYLLNKTNKTITLKQGQSVACFQSTTDLEGEGDVGALLQGSTNFNVSASGGVKEKREAIASSVDNEDATYGSAQVAEKGLSMGLLDSAYEASVRKFYGYDHLACEIFNDSGDKEHDLSDGLELNTVTCTIVNDSPRSDSRHSSGTVLSIGTVHWGLRRGKPSLDKDTMRSSSELSCEVRPDSDIGRAVSECVTLFTPIVVEVANDSQPIVEPVGSLKFTSSSGLQVSPESRSQDVATDTVLVSKTSESNIKAGVSTCDLGEAEGSARSIFEPNYLKYMETLQSEFSKNIVDKILALPHVQECEVPDYFTGSKLDDGKLPDYLKGWGVEMDDLAVTKDEFNLFIYEVLALPMGRAQLFEEMEPGCVLDFEASIELEDSTPWYARLRPGSNEDKAEFKIVLDRYLAQKLIRTIANPECTSPCMLVKKKGGRNQFAIDYRELNKRSKACLFPLPLLVDCLDALGLASFNSSLDINGAYHSIKVAESSQKHLAFVTHYGLFTWVRLPYGYKNSGPIFCKVIFETLQELIYVMLTMYVDDVKVFGGSTVRLHMKCLALAINLLQQKGFRMSVRKCKFFVNEMDHLGVTASIQSTKPTRGNVKKITSIQISSVKHIRSFVGAANYYRRFVPGYAQIVAPLLEFLKKDARLPKVLPPKIVQAIDKLKEILTTFPVLRNPDFKLQFILEVDASKQGFGIALKQIHEGIECVCAYGSSHLSTSMLKYSPEMLELIGGVWGMEHFQHYLRNRKFILKTDNVILKWLRAKSLVGTKAAFIKWVLIAQTYDFEVVHVPGKHLVLGDFLSREGARYAPVDKSLEEHESHQYCAKSVSYTNVNMRKKGKEQKKKALKTFVFDKLDRTLWIREQSFDRRLQRALDSPYAERFTSVDGLWFKQGRNQRQRVVVPASLRATLMVLVHSYLGHRGVKPMVRYMSRTLYWPGMWVYVRAWVLSCSDCRRRKMSRKTQAWLGHVKHITRPWYCVAIDFVLAELPVTKDGFKFCLTVMCVFTRYPFAIPLKSKEPEELALALFTYVFSFFGFPTVVLSDHDTSLINTVMQLVFERFGVKRDLTLWNRPQSNGHLERFHRYLNETMCIILPRYADWVEMLPVMLFAFRNLVQASTGYSPHYLNFGRDALMPVDMSWCMGEEQSLFDRRDLNNTTSGFVAALIARLQAAFTLVRKVQKEASEKNKKRLVQTKGGIEVPTIVFRAGDQVYLLEESSVHNKVGAMRVEIPKPNAFTPRKWCFKWTGIHEVLRPKGERAYVIKHKQREVELTVHVDALRLHIPFSEDVQDTAQVSRFAKRQDLPPPEGCNVWFTDARGTGPEVGDLIIARKPEFEEQEFVVVQKVSETQYQWFGYNRVNYFLKKNLSSYETLAQTRWNPGWWWPKQNLPSYEYDQPQGTIPFLVDIADFATEPMVWGFHLKGNRRLSAPLCEWVELYCNPFNNTRQT